MPNLRRVLLATALLIASGVGAPRAAAQTRERPVPFDDAGHVTVITPPLAARLGLAAPVWPVSGDYVEARLYALEPVAGGGHGSSYVLVVRRQQDVLERSPMDSAQRAALAEAVAQGDRAARIASGPDSMPTYISEPVRATFVANQTVLGLLLFGPAAATAIADPAGSSAAYLLVAGSSFFISAGITASEPVSRAQNHLSWHSARRGAIAAELALFAIGGDGIDSKGYGAAAFAGGLAGDIIGFQLAKPMTDAEAHGTSHGSTVTAALTAGALGTAGFYEERGLGRAASALIIGAGAVGYPLGLRYVRTAPYRVTAGDVGTMVTTELLGIGVAGTLIPDNSSPAVSYGLLTAGFAAGAIAGERLLVRPYDHTESEARLLQFGAGAGALLGLTIPVLASSGGRQLILGTATAGGILGAIMAENLLAPRRAGKERGDPDRRTGAAREERPSRLDVRFNPAGAVMAGLGQRGQHSILSASF